MTVQQWLEIWQNEYTVNLKDTTKRSYKDNIRLHINPYIGTIELSNLTSLHIQKMYNRLAESGRHLQKGQKKEAPPGLSAKSIRNVHVILHKALKQACKPPHSLIRYNPSEGTVLPTIEHKEMKILSDDEMARMLEAMKNHWHYAIYHTALYCGLRRGEVLGIEIANIHFEDRYIDITRQLQRERVKGGQLRLVPLKNNRPRRVYPSDAVFDVIKGRLYLREQMKKDAGKDWEESGLLFTNDKGRALDSDAVYQAFKTLLRKANVPDIRLHDLRHTYATVSLASGVDVKTLQESLGHYDPGFTLKQYGHATPTMRRDASDKVSAYIEKARAKNGT